MSRTSWMVLSVLVFGVCAALAILDGVNVAALVAAGVVLLGTLGASLAKRRE